MCAIHSAFAQALQSSNHLQYPNAHALIRISLGTSPATLQVKVKEVHRFLGQKIAFKKWSDTVQRHWDRVDQWGFLVDEKRSFLERQRAKLVTLPLKVYMKL